MVLGSAQYKRQADEPNVSGADEIDSFNSEAICVDNAEGQSEGKS